MTEKISCICPTYGRIPTHLHLLEESVYWFTQQTYPNKELIILNDCPQQRIFCNVQNVRVINSPSRFKTLGEKYNALVKEAKGTIIVPWEDDDISLPERLAQAESKLREGCDYFNPQRSWFESSGKLHSDHKHGVCHNASAYRVGLFNRVGGYPHVCGNQDSEFDRLCKQLGKMAESVIDMKDWQYIYRWGVSPTHLSGAKDMQDFYNKVTATNGLAQIMPVRHRDYALLIATTLDGKCGQKCDKENCVKGRCGPKTKSSKD